MQINVTKDLFAISSYQLFNFGLLLGLFSCLNPVRYHSQVTNQMTADSLQTVIIYMCISFNTDN